MHDLTISLVQTQQFWEKKEENLIHFENLLNQQLIGQTDVIIFPEMFHTGFTMNVVLLAESMAESTGIQWLQKIAKKYDSLCIASLIVKEAGQFFNRMVAVFPDGTVQHYDKIHLFTLAKEDEFFSPGKSKTIVKFRGWKILLQVCYDLRFPENARNSVNITGDFDFDLIVYVANWPERRIAHWDKLLPSRAIENQCYVAAVNRVGIDNNDLIYNGSSQIINGLGEYEIHPIKQQEDIQTALISRDSLVELRQKLSFLKDRRL